MKAALRPVLKLGNTILSIQIRLEVNKLLLIHPQIPVGATSTYTMRNWDGSHQEIHIWLEEEMGNGLQQYLEEIMPSHYHASKMAGGNCQHTNNLNKTP